MPRFVVHCRVSGGITGTRESNLRDANGTVYFPTIEEAEAEAEAKRQRASISPYSQATFTYQAQEA